MEETPKAPASRWACWARWEYAYVLTSSVGVLILFSFVTARFEKIFIEMEMRELPLPTEAVLALSPFVRGPVGLALVLLAWAGLNLLALRGTLDALLQRMTWVNAIGMGLLFTVWGQSITLPILRIREHLEK